MPLGWQLPRRLCGATVLHLCMAPSLLSLSLAESLTGQWLSSAAWMWMQDFCGGAALSALERVYPFERPSIFHNVRTKSFVFSYSSHIIKAIPMTELHWCALQPEITWRWCVTLLNGFDQHCGMGNKRKGHRTAFSRSKLVHYWRDAFHYHMKSVRWDSNSWRRWPLH